MSAEPSPVLNHFDIQADILDEQELQSPENWELITPLAENDVYTLADKEIMEDMVLLNSRDVVHATDKDYRR